MYKKVGHLAFLFLIFFTFSCAVQSVESDVAQLSYPDMVQENYKHYIYKNGNIYLEASIKHAETYELKKKIECKNVNANIYNSKKEITSRLKSDKAVVDNGSSSMVFSGNVEVDKIDKEVKLFTDKLSINYKDNIMTCDSDVVIKKDDGSILKAKTMVSEFKNEVINFTGLDTLYYYEDDETDDANE